MALWKSFVGQYRVELVSGDLSRMLTDINAQGVLLQEVRFIDELHLEATVSRTQFLNLEKLINGRGEELSIRKRTGIFWKLSQIKKRPVLVSGLLLLCVLCLFLPSRILFIEVSGNAEIPDRYIIETAKECGLSFFVPRREVRSEKIKNALLSALPQLQWVGVNTKGCVASITVRERDEAPMDDGSFYANSIVAGRDGIVQEITVLSGTPLCKVGQGVKAGDVLVSGYTDCGLVIKLQQADAEIYAYTFRQLQAVTPVKAQNRTATQNKKRKIMLRIGKNIINLWKDSGISDTSCVKIYKEEHLTLPGGFQLPLALITEQCFQSKFSNETTLPSDWMETAADKYLQSCMIAGKVLQKDSVITTDENLSVLKGRYTCLEMIGQKRYEENIIHNGS